MSVRSYTVSNGRPVASVTNKVIGGCVCFLRFKTNVAFRTNFEDLWQSAIIIIIIFIYLFNCNWVVTRWQWLFYMYTKYEIGY